MNPEMLKQLAEKATANEVALWARAVDGKVPVSEVRKIVDSADVVFAVWPDDTNPGGVGHRIVKGEHLMTNIVADGFGQTYAVDAIKCLEEDDAGALEDFCLNR